MKIYAISYSNIWPFFNQVLSIYLHDWRFLIKAPIGSWKSFLFFDGIVFGLYGYSKRDMLNVQSKDGRVKILFKNEDNDIYYIERPLSGKKWVKLMKYLWVITSLETFWSHSQIIEYNKDFSLDLDFTQFESIEFHRSSEVQQHIDLLLPPRSVFLNRHIFMQDSENIFDLQPKSRIDILKLMFGLDTIDSIRDDIGEIKNNLRWQLKVLQDASHVNKQYDAWFASFKPKVTIVNERFLKIKISTLFWERISYYDQIIQNLYNFVCDPLSVHSDSLHNEILDRSLSPLLALLQDIKSNADITLAETSHIKKQILDWDIQIQELQAEKNTIELSIAVLQHDLTLAQASQVDQNALILEMQLLQTELDRMDAGVTPDAWKICQTYKALYSLQDARSCLVFFECIDKLLQYGKLLKSESEAHKQKILNFNLRLQAKDKELELSKNQLETIKNSQRTAHQEFLKGRVLQYNQLIHQSKEKIQLLLKQKTSLEKNSDYSMQKGHKIDYMCKKIQLNCPFLQEIIAVYDTKNVNHSNELTIELTNIQDHIRKTEQDLLWFEKELLQAQNDISQARFDLFVYGGKEYETQVMLIEQLSSGELSAKEKLESADLMREMDSITHKIDALRDDYKYLQSIAENIALSDYKILLTKISKINDSLLEGQKEQQKTQNILLSLTENNSNLDRCNKSIADIGSLHKERVALLNSKLSDIESYKEFNFDEMLLCFRQLEQSLYKAKDLFLEKKRIQEEQQKTKEELDKANLLHSIFGKELTLYILQSYIPLLNEYINALLFKVVSFQISISVNDDGDELLLLIEDELWTREVKSLSGWQKTVLKLCWVLATSIVFRNHFLLLDETINNIDSSITSKLADMLLDYLKQYNLTFYTVTHSPQIQEMDIWDQVIQIKDNTL